MSKIQQLIAAINVSVTQIDSQEMRIRDFNRRLEEMRSQIDTVMGTENPSAQRMLSHHEPEHGDAADAGGGKGQAAADSAGIGGERCQ